MTIGGQVVVQVNHISGDHCKLMVDAPREMTILRGEVLERQGGERPACVVDAPFQHRQELTWNRNKARTLAAMRLRLSRMDGGSEDVQALKRQLDYLFPPETSPGGTGTPPEKKVSTG